MSESTNLWKNDAERFRELDRGEGWAFAACIASAVEPGTGHGKRGARPVSGKVSATEFATEAGTEKKRVMRYYRTWEKAAAEGLVPSCKDLVPGGAAGLALPDIDWKKYYAAPKNAQEERTAEVLRTVPPMMIARAIDPLERATVAAEIVKSSPGIAKMVVSTAGTAIDGAMASLKQEDETGEADPTQQVTKDKEKKVKDPVLGAERSVTRASTYAANVFMREDLEEAEVEQMVNVQRGALALADQIDAEVKNFYAKRDGLNEDDEVVDLKIAS